MATFTPNYNLRKPATTDLVTVSTDLNANFDTIDSEIKEAQDGVATTSARYVNCTSGTRPAHAEGRMIYETDTDTVWVSDGAAWSIFDTAKSWTAVTFSNSWVDFGGTFQTSQYRKVGDKVQVRGVIKNGVVGNSAFTLPTGFRPPAATMHSSNSNNGEGRIDVQTTGEVVPASGSNAWFSLFLEFWV